MAAPRHKPPTLWSPGTILKPWGWFLALLGFVATIAGFAQQDLSFVQATLAPQGDYINLRTLVLALIASNFLTFYLVYRLLYKERSQRRDDADENGNLRVLLDDIERERLLDLHTGIPNEKKFTNDFESLKETNLSTLAAQIILIDIDDFGSVNNKYGYQKGNEVIRLIAQRMFFEMRRNERFIRREVQSYTGASLAVTNSFCFCVVLNMRRWAFSQPSLYVVKKALTGDNDDFERGVQDKLSWSDSSYLPQGRL